jgi:structural maintenance of chromosome 4
LNGGKTSRDEVVARLKDEQIDLDHNRFLILQGEVQSIACQKALELLEFLEDIAGTSSFKERIEQAEKIVVDLSGTHRIQADRFAVAKKARDKHKEGRDNAMAHRKLNGRLTVIKGLRMLGDQAVVADKWKRQKKVCRERQKVIAERQKDLHDAEEEDRRSKEAESQEDARLRELEDEVERTRKEYVDTRKRVADAEGRLEGLEKKADEFGKTATEHQQARDAAVEVGKLAVEQIDKLTPERDRAEEARNEAREALDAATDQATIAVQGVQEELRAKQDKGVFASDRVLALKGDIGRMQSEIDSIEKKAKDAEGAKLERIRQRDELEGRLSDARAVKSRLEGEIEWVRQESAELDAAEREVALRDTQKFRDEMADARNALEQIQQRIEKDRTARVIQDYLGAHDIPRDHVMGQVGALAVKAGVAAKYQVGMSLALGGVWGDWLVQSDDLAQQLIEEIKRERIGRTHFQILNKLSPPPQLGKEPMGCQWAIRLIQAQDEVVQRVFGSFLGETVICEGTAEEARQVAYHSRDGRRYRVVTTEGAVLEAGGAITGGGRDLRQTLFKVPQTPGPREVERAEKRFGDLNGEWKGICNAREEIMRRRGPFGFWPSSSTNLRPQIMSLGELRH